jgi:hypothetical protein
MVRVADFVAVAGEKELAQVEGRNKKDGRKIQL